MIAAKAVLILLVAAAEVGFILLLMPRDTRRWFLGGPWHRRRAPSPEPELEPEPGPPADIDGTHC